MTPDQWQQIKNIFQAAIERDPGQRATFVAEACQGDAKLREEVERLLALHEEAGDFIETPASNLAARVLGKAREESIIGSRIGSYRIVREIGRGGMGAVYLAVRDDDQFQKQVAIKLVKRGMDSEKILQRFRNERQILASLDHPNIASLLDGGTTDNGLPYFVMDYIEGVPIDRYCDGKNLSTVERLKLFRTVCLPVHYAHQSLVVHRDLKPSNILITNDGTPKLLDFGIAKVIRPKLDGATIDQTVTVGLMTPAYASPEQVLGKKITTASDVYSLGVVLYQLLAGCAPYSLKSVDAEGIVKVICEEEPPKPSTAVLRFETASIHTQTQVDGTSETVDHIRRVKPQKLRRRLSGDLDNIVLMAMRKDPQQRYASVEQFSEDIRRHLEGRPVIARKDTLAYRSSKFIMRNKAGVFAASLILVSLLAGLAVALWQGRVARAEKSKAERRFSEVRTLAHSLLFNLDDKIAKEPTEARGLLVNMAQTYLDRLAQEASGDPSLQRELADAYDKVGDIMGNPFGPNLGDPVSALESYRKALSIREGLSAVDPNSIQARRDLAQSYSRIALMMWAATNTTKVIENASKALEIYDQLLAAQPADQDRRDRAICLGILAEALVWSGSIAAAEEKIREAVAVLERLASDNPNDLRKRADLATAYDKQGVVLQAAGDSNGALAILQKQLSISDELARLETNDTTRRNLAFSLMRVGDVLYEIGNQKNSAEQYSKALDCFRKSMTISEALAERDSKNVRAQREVSISYNKVGDALWMTGDIRSAHESYQKALRIRESLAQQTNYASYKNDLAVSYGRVGEASTALGDAAAGIENLQKAVEIFQSVSDADPTNAVTRRDLGVTTSDLAKAHAQRASQSDLSIEQRIEHWNQARSWYQRSLDIFNDLRTRGLLRRSDVHEPDTIAKEIARCDAALEKLKQSSSSSRLK